MASREFRECLPCSSRAHSRFAASRVHSWIPSPSLVKFLGSCLSRTLFVLVSELFPFSDVHFPFEPQVLLLPRTFESSWKTSSLQVTIHVQNLNLRLFTKEVYLITILTKVSDLVEWRIGHWVSLKGDNYSHRKERRVGRRGTVPCDEEKTQTQTNLNFEGFPFLGNRAHTWLAPSTTNCLSPGSWLSSLLPYL